MVRPFNLTWPAHYVKEAVVYMVTDDLAVKPLTVSSITAVLGKNDIKATRLLRRRLSVLARRR
ncbi:hypothetical protein CDL15_Pgr022647 [Punica granatum]|uniref:Uncharacterized protein n=1 Tax=Punica granatum TaxID=22663 RepID=A0A218XQS7_PUNGR|nr:hypothetical protein CDL15_Pgr022647 [Punica granatum]